ncbi:hypothetical protein BT69DRAFT_1322739 [Atractiella rhizophila]|nr:hypothetical protein BT69DRAFT_1322739 [Atractiella rhizophila]
MSAQAVSCQTIISRLPVEVFISIVAYLPSLSVVRVTHVCQIWRKAVLGTPMLWRDLHLHSGSEGSLEQLSTQWKAWYDRRLTKVPTDINFDGEGPGDLVPLRSFVLTYNSSGGLESLARMFSAISTHQLVKSLCCLRIFEVREEWTGTKVRCSYWDNEEFQQESALFQKLLLPVYIAKGTLNVLNITAYFNFIITDLNDLLSQFPLLDTMQFRTSNMPLEGILAIRDPFQFERFQSVKDLADLVPRREVLPTTINNSTAFKVINLQTCHLATSPTWPFQLPFDFPELSLPEEIVDNHISRFSRLTSIHTCCSVDPDHKSPDFYKFSQFCASIRTLRRVDVSMPFDDRDDSEDVFNMEHLDTFGWRRGGVLSISRFVNRWHMPNLRRVVFNECDGLPTSSFHILSVTSPLLQEVDLIGDTIPTKGDHALPCLPSLRILRITASFARKRGKFKVSDAFILSIFLSQTLEELYFNNVSSSGATLVSFLKARLSAAPNTPRLQLISMINGSNVDLEHKQWITAHTSDLAGVGCSVVMG